MRCLEGITDSMDMFERAPGAGDGQGKGLAPQQQQQQGQPPAPRGLLKMQNAQLHPRPLSQSLGHGASGLQHAPGAGCSSRATTSAFCYSISAWVCLTFFITKSKHF